MSTPLLLDLGDGCAACHGPVGSTPLYRVEDPDDARAYCWCVLGPEQSS